MLMALIHSFIHSFILSFFLSFFFSRLAGLRTFPTLYLEGEMEGGCQVEGVPVVGVRYSLVEGSPV